MVEVLHWYIEVVDAVVDVVCVAVVATCGFTMVLMAFVITHFKHQPFNPLPSPPANVTSAVRTHQNLASMQRQLDTIIGTRQTL